MREYDPNIKYLQDDINALRQRRPQGWDFKEDYRCALRHLKAITAQVEALNRAKDES